MQKTKLENLASENSTPCVTISMNTHRTHPDNLTDIITFKNLLKQTQERLLSTYEKRDVAGLLEKLDSLKEGLDVNYNLESLHLFISNSTLETVKSTWPVSADEVQIGESFNLKSLIKAYNRTEEYYILSLSQSGVHLFLAANDAISDEIKNEDFPFSKNPHYSTEPEKNSDGKHVDNLIREFFNVVDKALLRLYHTSGMRCVVFCTEENYTRLLQVADKPSLYPGFVKINYNNTSEHTFATEAWKVMETLQNEDRKEAVAEMQEAMGQGKLLTDLSEIYRAAKEGRGDLLIVHDDFQQAVKITGEFTFDLADEAHLPGITDDIASEIAWEVFSKKGRVVYTQLEEFNTIGKIALKVRY